MDKFKPTDDWSNKMLVGKSLTNAMEDGKKLSKLWKLAAFSKFKKLMNDFYKEYSLKFKTAVHPYSEWLNFMGNLEGKSSAFLNANNGKKGEKESYLSALATAAKKSAENITQKIEEELPAFQKFCEDLKQEFIDVNSNIKKRINLAQSITADNAKKFIKEFVEGELSSLQEKLGKNSDFKSAFYKKNPFLNDFYFNENDEAYIFKKFSNFIVSFSRTMSIYVENLINRLGKWDKKLDDKNIEDFKKEATASAEGLASLLEKSLKNFK